MNFFVNKAMGIGNSGVEHAQFYRAKIFKQQNIPYKFIFTELVNNLHLAMDKWNLKEEEVINIWEYFVLGEDYLLNGVTKRSEASRNTLVDFTNTNRKLEIVTESGIEIREFFIKLPSMEKDNMLLVSTDHVELYNHTTGELKVNFYVDRRFKREDRIVNIHLYNQGQHKHLFFPNLVQLHRYFFDILNDKFGPDNVFIVDRGEENEVALMDVDERDYKILDIVHADHLSDRDVKEVPLWNNYNEYVLTHFDKIDRLVVATKLQREDLLIDFPDAEQKIVAIPVGGVADFAPKISGKKNGDETKLITVSRLASEKHIDLVAKAVVELRKQGENVTLDIFGQGSSRTDIQKVIDENKAEDYIHLMGLTNHPEEEYPKYDAFVSASFSEGFGLTYIEAMNAALPVITFNARFGAQELVENGVNGFAVDFKRDDNKYNVEQLVAGIKKFIAIEDIEGMQQQVVDSVAEFKDAVIGKKWKDMLNEL